MFIESVSMNEDGSEYAGNLRFLLSVLRNSVRVVCNTWDLMIGKASLNIAPIPMQRPSSSPRSKPATPARINPILQMKCGAASMLHYCGS